MSSSFVTNLFWQLIAALIFSPVFFILFCAPLGLVGMLSLTSSANKKKKKKTSFLWCIMVHLRFRERDRWMEKDLVRASRCQQFVYFKKSWKVKIIFFGQTLMRWIIRIYLLNFINVNYVILTCLYSKHSSVTIV